MAIEKNSFKGSRFDPEFSPNSRETMSSDEDEVQRRVSAAEYDDDDDEFDDADSGAGSDDFDLLELGETGAEFCQIGNLTCSVTFELYDLSGLEDILSVDVWNEVLTDEERFSLTKYLPDLDQDTFMRTLKELFEGQNFHFGSPIKKLFEMLKGGLCEPRVALYREGLGFFQKRQHYHLLRKHQNNMVSNLCQIRDAWLNCRGYSIEEKLRVLNIIKSEKNLIYEKMEEDLESKSSEREELGDRLRGKRVKDRKSAVKLGLNSACGAGSNLELASRISSVGLEVPKYRKQNPKEHGETIWHGKNQGHAISMGSSLKSDDRNMRSKKWKAGRESPDLNVKTHRASSPQVNDRILLSDLKAKSSKEKIKANFVQKGGPDKGGKKLNRMFAKNEETESDSSEQFDNDDDDPLVRSKSTYPSGSMEVSRTSLLKSGLDAKKGKFVKKDMQEKALAFGGMTDFSKNMGGFNENALARLGRRAYVPDRRDRSDASVQGFNLMTKKRKAKEELTNLDRRDEDGNVQSSLKQQIDDSISLKKKGKRKVESDTGTSDMETPEPPLTEMGAADMGIDSKPQKKPYTPITPTVHTGFSFSIIHLLSAVRLAMISPLPEDSLEVIKPSDGHNGKHEGGTNGVVSCESADVNKSDHALQVNVPSLTIQEIVNRVRSNPGDPCILETQEPLQDLVRGVLKILSSKTAPLGAKGWKALGVYEKSAKSWSWIGPVSHTSTDHETIEEVTSPEYWGLPHKMLVKLVDSFANWLKSGQETLQQIGSLPAPPVSLMQCNLDEKERFRDLRAQKSLNTISPSSEEVRAYFRKEEFLRYSIPDRAFSYTAADSKKSIVAPLRRCGGKPTSKARDHFMLKRDRPPHVTILCLVRDAAARLPGSMGTRADVCTLIRDSQYIVEDVSDAQVNQVVSGALDRLHYERDPCVQFDGERKLWVYLHREREEEDFEDDGTSSTKKWKRQKKDPADQPDQGAVTVAFHGNVDQSGFDLGSDLNVAPSGPDDDKRTKLVHNDAKQSMEDNAETSHVSEQSNMHQGHPVVWDTLSLNPMRKINCYVKKIQQMKILMMRRLGERGQLDC
ncbi:hypothetical protein GH714_003972 [Hevea brasiliensis]|uniref:DEUBAD domain-containing protein n=1 Tax=Hevea brasiliensis TaxID=3981 RepID=A0A6A6K4P0_HEVBR|nr:hypothetical protein GH714_003972 [Hevea brasiliensis]